MFNWFTKKEEKIVDILNHKNVSEKEVFEDFVRKTYKDNIKSLHQYNVTCSKLKLNDICVRIAGAANFVVFYNESDECFYYLETIDTNKDRDFVISYNFSTLLENYIDAISTDNPTFLKLKELL